MKTAGWPTVLIFALATCLYALTLPRLGEVQQQRQLQEAGALGEIPTEVVQALSFEFNGVVADFLMLKAMTFMGERIGKNQELTAGEWQHLYRLLDKITGIDPRFWDPYLLAETMFAWQAGMVEEANALLKKATVFRPHDYRPWYFLGFNEFYFRKDTKKAAQYLRKAAQFPECPSYIQGLATRFSLFGNETKLAIVMLNELLQETKDDKIRQYLTKRLAALDAIFLLEEKVLEYRKRHDSLPESLDELVSSGLLAAIPPDPYGGQFVLMKNGRIYTTSELLEKKK